MSEPTDPPIPDMAEGLSPIGDGRYELTHTLSKGGSHAALYGGTDTQLGQPRAIKILTTSDSALRSRFLEECTTTMALRHPGVVDVYDVGTEGDQAYMVTEMLRGGSLLDWVRQNGAMPSRTAAEAILGALNALIFAHMNFVVHGDLKPSNLLLTRSGAVKLTDFGLVRVFEDLEDHGYLAPEQRGGRTQVDARADVYALGAILYMLVSGKEPSATERLDAGALQMGSIPDDILAVIEQATEYVPDDRYESAQSMLDDLKLRLDSLPIPDADAPPLASAPAEPTLNFGDLGDESSAPRAVPLLPPKATEDEAADPSKLTGTPAPVNQRLPSRGPPEEVEGSQLFDPKLYAVAGLAVVAALTFLVLAISYQFLLGGGPQLEVQSYPPSLIYVDGTYVGQSPWKGPVPAGTHVIGFRMENGTSGRQTVDVLSSGGYACWNFRSNRACE